MDPQEQQSMDAVLACLAGGKRLETVEIEDLTREARAGCADSTARLLRKMKDRGLIDGQLDIAKKTWIWWAKGEA